MAPRTGNAPVEQGQEFDDEEIEGQDGTDGPDDGGFEGAGEGGDQEGAGDTPDDLGPEQTPGLDEDVTPRSERVAGRATDRIQRLASENAELKRRLSERGTAQPTQQPQLPQEETEEQFRARIQLLPPDERLEARHERSERVNGQRLALLQLQNADLADKMAFDSKATTDARYQRYANAVEEKRLELRNQGQVVPREAILKFLIGERVLSGQGSKAVRQGRQQAQQRVQRQQTRPVGAGSDTSPAGRRGAPSEADARRRRLENMGI
jgi:hypothetical protein